MQRVKGTNMSIVKRASILNGNLKCKPLQVLMRQFSTSNGSYKKRGIKSKALHLVNGG